MAKKTISVALITQGHRRFFSGSMDIEVLAEVCFANPRIADPQAGFQRTLDEKRADLISVYIELGGTIPSGIILSARKEAKMVYTNKNRSVEFEVHPAAFLILDGQHRVFGFRKLKERKPDFKYRVPVIIYYDLSPLDEARIFIDINTLQKPVPKELLLDIKSLAERETEEEVLLDQVFTHFETRKDSYLINKLSRHERTSGKISKVTFYDSIKPIVRAFQVQSPERLFQILNAYLNAASDIYGEQTVDFSSEIVRPTAFRILMAHAKSVIALLSDHSHESVTKISEHKRYLLRSLPSSINEIRKAKAYAKTVESLEKKLFTRNITI